MLQNCSCKKSPETSI